MGEGADALATARSVLGNLSGILKAVGIRDLDAATEQQDAVIGPPKFDGVELDDAESGQKVHKTLATIVVDDGVQHDILCGDMPFGGPGTQFGTYFIGTRGSSG